MAELDALLRQLKQAGGSDLHLAAGREPRLRLHGELALMEGQPVLDHERLMALLQPVASEMHWNEFVETNDVDFAYGLEGVGRFRVNYFVQEYGAAAAFRLIPEKIVSLEELKLPDAIGKLAQLRNGLVVVTGPTGSGKSTTLAAIVHRINGASQRHIVTIEDPVEFVHQNQQSVLSHREVGIHSGSFGAALRAAVRQDADVVLVGEMRDRETIAMAITAAEMGTLVFGTLHTSGAAKTIDRIIDAFPSSEQNQVRLSLSESLVAVVSQLLLPSADGSGRVAVNEILLRTQGLPNVIREGNTQMLDSIIQSGRGEGMQGMDDALHELLKAGRINPRDAYMKAREKARFEALVPGD